MPHRGDQDDTGKFRRMLEESADGVVDQIDRVVDGGLNRRERDIAAATAHAVVGYLASIPRSRADNVRLSDLEGWRANEITPWKLRLTGVDERNGRLGRLDARVEANHADILAVLAELREDVGTRQERAAERATIAPLAGVRHKLLASVGAAVIAAGSAAWGWRNADRAAASAEARTALRLEHVESTTNRLLCKLGLCGPTDPNP